MLSWMVSMLYLQTVKLRFITLGPASTVRGRDNTPAPPSAAAAAPAPASLRNSRRVHSSLDRPGSCDLSPIALASVVQSAPVFPNSMKKPAVHAASHLR